MLAAMERLACVLEAKDSPTEKQQELVDGMITNLYDLPFARGSDQSKITRMIETKRARLNETGKQMLLERLNAQIEKQKSVLVSRQAALKDAQHKFDHPEDTRFMRSLDDDVDRARRSLEKSHQLMQLLKDEKKILITPPTQPRGKGMKPGPQHPPRKGPRK
jgi:hypothetical protein